MASTITGLDIMINGSSTSQTGMRIMCQLCTTCEWQLLLAIVEGGDAVNFDRAAGCLKCTHSDNTPADHDHDIDHTVSTATATPIAKVLEGPRLGVPRACSIVLRSVSQTSRGFSMPSNINHNLETSWSTSSTGTTLNDHVKSQSTGATDYVDTVLHIGLANSGCSHVYSYDDRGCMVEPASLWTDCLSFELDHVHANDGAWDHAVVDHHNVFAAKYSASAYDTRGERRGRAYVNCFSYIVSFVNDIRLCGRTNWSKETLCNAGITSAVVGAETFSQLWRWCQAVHLTIPKTPHETAECQPKSKTALSLTILTPPGNFEENKLDTDNDNDTTTTNSHAMSNSAGGVYHRRRFFKCELHRSVAAPTKTGFTWSTLHVHAQECPVCVDYQACHTQWIDAINVTPFRDEVFAFDADAIKFDWETHNENNDDNHNSGWM